MEWNWERKIEIISDYFRECERLQLQHGLREIREQRENDRLAILSRMSCSREMVYISKLPERFLLVEEEAWITREVNNLNLHGCNCFVTCL